LDAGEKKAFYTPERTDLLGLAAPVGKSLKLDPQHDELFEMLGGRIIAAQFPMCSRRNGRSKAAGPDSLASDPSWCAAA
jgi:hypothetical protein